jgi:tRNA(Arg) A34 adenosine deaminase TadA
MRITTSLVDRGWSSKDGKIKPQDRVSGNNIGAIMVDKDNKIIGWGLNLKSENKTFHAETLMIQRYLKENNTDKLPDGVKIFTSLECCHMCSAHITSLGNNIRVIYAQKDPYFNGENTLSQGKNGCTQERTTLNFPDIFKATMGNEEDILDFLFSKAAKQIFSRGFQDAALFVELMETVRKNKEKNNKALSPKNPTVSPIMQYGEHFLEKLGNYTFKSEDTVSPLFFRSRTPSPPRERKPKEELPPNGDSRAVLKPK